MVLELLEAKTQVHYSQDERGKPKKDLERINKDLDESQKKIDEIKNQLKAKKQEG